uniref:Rab9 effector protein with kelch motifs n=2 Tax=Arion vulgaris TaxID=1028688 RepID=A0A0B7A8P7_9EUPU
MAVELHPFLETDTRPSPNWWYVLSISGSSPSMRVGHTATFVQAVHSDEHDKVFIIGGANPEQVFNEVYVLDLVVRSWDTLEAPGFRGRYEHSAFCVKNRPGVLFVFGGATQSGSLNDVQSMNISSGVWSDVEVSGTLPAPRTHHSCAVIGSHVYFYSGGHIGPDPVGDRRVHCLDTSTMSWQSITPLNSPKPRHGHLMVSYNNRIFLHGGVSGSTFYDDLFILDPDRNSWASIKKKKTAPSPRAAHGGIISNKDIFMFGGMNKSGALNEGYKFNTEMNTWSKLELEGPPPSNRLDFAICTIPLRVPVSSLKLSQKSQTDLTALSTKALHVLDPELKPDCTSSGDSTSDNAIVVESACAQEIDIITNGQQTSTDGNRSMAEQNAQQTIIDSNCSTAEQKVDIQKGQQASTHSNCSEAEQKADIQNGQLVPDTEEVTMILINGGMDTEGEIFDDTLVLML